MYLQHFGLKHSPFTRRPGPNVFFVQAGRKNILKNLRDDFRQGETAMLLTGPQGAGKTILCRLIRHRLNGSSCRVVHLENPVVSFDDLLRQICLKLGMASDGKTEQDIPSVLRLLVRQQKEQGRLVLLLIDDAEKMFLAALERLFRLLNALNAEYGMHALLVGQPGLNASIEQLSGYCEDVRIASTYALEAFSLEETATYLAYRLKVAGDERGAADPIFTREAVQEIFRLSKGVPGVMDAIAEAALKNAAAAGNNSVVPVHVVMPETAVALPAAPDEEKPGKGRKGILLFLLVLSLIAFLFWGKTSFFTGRKEAPQEAVQEGIGVRPENTEIAIGSSEEENAPLPFVEEEEDDSSDEAGDSLQPPEGPALLALPVPGRPDFKKKDDTQATEVETKEEGKGEIQVAPIKAEEKKSREEAVTSGEAFGEQDVLPEASVQTAAVNEETTQPRQEPAPDVPAAEQVKVNELTEVAEQQREEQVEQQVEKEPEGQASEEPGQAVPSDASGEDRTESLSTAKKLPVIKPTWIIELRPGMKKTRLSAAEGARTVPEHGESDEPDEAASPAEVKKAASAPPQQKTLIPVASARVTGAAVPAPQSPLPPGPKIAEVIPVPRIEIPSVRPSSPSGQADQLFARYLAAGNRWTKGGYGDKFTVQLLVLSSDDAAEMIKEMIVRDEYREYSRKLHILRRDTLPPTLFVCYGVYSSMDEARNARNTMPLFLRKHHPYALSISDVLTKAGN